MLLMNMNVMSGPSRPSPYPAVETWNGRRLAKDLHFPATGEAELRCGVSMMPSGRRRAALDSPMEAILREDLAECILPFDSGAACAHAGSRQEVATRAGPSARPTARSRRFRRIAQGRKRRPRRPMAAGRRRNPSGTRPVRPLPATSGDRDRRKKSVGKSRTPFRQRQRQARWAITDGGAPELPGTARCPAAICMISLIMRVNPFRTSSTVSWPRSVTPNARLAKRRCCRAGQIVSTGFRS